MKDDHRCRNPRCGKERKRRADGRLEGACGLCKPCYVRWHRAGKPEVVPDPLTHEERTALSTRAKQQAAMQLATRDDEYVARCEAGKAERRARLIRAQEAALFRCMAAGDEKGVREIRLRITDWEAVAILAAQRAVAAAARPARPLVPVAKAQAWQAVTHALRAVVEEVRPDAA